MSKCKCSMAISLNGEGCRYCQPQTYIDSLEGAIAEDEQDAERFRWLRDKSAIEKGIRSEQGKVRPANFVRFPLLEGSELGAAIDAAIAAKKVKS